MKKIKEFQGEYRWLSNFAPCNVILDGITYPSVENAYQSAKSNEYSWKQFCSQEQNPGKVKKWSKNLIPRYDWEKDKINVMRELLNQKFTQEPYKTLLLNTGTTHIQEGNYWGDEFWGVNLKTNKGKNTLGQLIMEIRERL